MTDVRSLLRNERASRRIDHPNASYSVKGALECSVCHIPLKSDIDVWNKHLKSTQHAMRAERLRLSKPGLPTREEKSPPSHNLPPANTKKRKASEDDDDVRKRTRPVVSPPAKAQAQTPHRLDKKPPGRTPESAELPTSIPTQPQLNQPTGQAVDEDEWAAFERDIAEPPLPSPPPGSTALPASQAVISAEPISAAELAAQEKEKERESGRERREDEMEAEKEDAARALEEEFEEMEGLEERVRRLRNMREELRLKRSESERKEQDVQAEDLAEGVVVAEESDDEDSQDEDIDEWGFGR